MRECREVLFRPKYLLSKIRLTDPMWNIKLRRERNNAIRADHNER